MARSYLPESKKLEIVELRAQKMTISEISKKIRRNFGTVRSFLQRYKKRKSIQNRKPTGRPPKITEKTKRQIVRHVKNNRRDTIQQIRNDLRLVDVSREAVNKIVLQSGLKSCKPSKKPLLSKKQRNDRLKWARKYAEKDEEFFEKWIFSDETSFVIGSSTGQKVRRQSNEHLHPECIGGSKKWGTKLFFWGAIWCE